MRRMTLALALLLFSGQATAQAGPPSGGGGRDGGPGSGPGGAPGGGAPGGGARPKVMKPIKRAQFDKAVAAMFELADSNQDGRLMLAELRAILSARREALIQARFAAVDADRNGAISAAEFLAWQQSMGSMARSEDQSVGGSLELTAADVGPRLGDGDKDRAMARLIAPLNAVLLVNADSNYDGSVSRPELLAHEGKRFEATDRDGDGKISEMELRRLDRDNGRGPGGQGPGMDGRGVEGPGAEGPGRADGPPAGDPPPCAGGDARC